MIGRATHGLTRAAAQDQGGHARSGGDADSWGPCR